MMTSSNLVRNSTGSSLTFKSELAPCANPSAFSGKAAPICRSNGGREEKPEVQHLLPLPLFPLLVAAFLVVAALIQIGILRFAYLRTGVSSRAAMALLLGSLIGSYINIPIVELPKRDVHSGVEASHGQRHHRIRRARTDTMAGTVIAVNVGGAVIPALLSLGSIETVHAKPNIAFSNFNSSLSCHRGHLHETQASTISASVGYAYIYALISVTYS
jgi:hypothetical protein